MRRLDLVSLPGKHLQPLRRPVERVALRHSCNVVGLDLYYDLCHGDGMTRTVQARLDERSEQDLAVLRNEGHSDSEAIRLALREAAERRRRKSALRLEAGAAAADADDRADALRVRAEMDAIAAVWTDAES